MIKIAFTDWFDNWSPESETLVDIIKTISSFEISDIRNADYVLFSAFGNKHLKAREDCIKIYYTGENLIPDFNICDYAIGFAHIHFGDRYFRLPNYYRYKSGINEKMEGKHTVNQAELLKSKKKFCSITVSNENRHPIFKTIFDELSTYKGIDSGGRWNNNIGKAVNDKLEFDSAHKFSIVCENSCAPGYTTEKIVEAFAAGCIPIYWGDPEIGSIFNPKAFINVSDYSSIKSVVDIVKTIDHDDNLFVQMAQTPAYLNKESYATVQKERCKEFLTNIFSQDKEKAQRRNRVCWGKAYIEQRIEDTRLFSVSKLKHTIYTSLFRHAN